MAVWARKAQVFQVEIGVLNPEFHIEQLNLLSHQIDPKAFVNPFIHDYRLRCFFESRPVVLNGDVQKPFDIAEMDVYLQSTGVLDILEGMFDCIFQNRLKQKRR